jgi:hypothetical protein
LADNRGVPFGLAAHHLKSITRKAGSTVILKWTDRMDPALLQPDQNAVVRLV